MTKRWGKQKRKLDNDLFYMCCSVFLLILTLFKIYNYKLFSIEQNLFSIFHLKNKSMALISITNHLIIRAFHCECLSRHEKSFEI